MMGLHEPPQQERGPECRRSPPEPILPSFQHSTIPIAREARYVHFALAPKGIQRHHFVRELFALAQQMTAPLLIKAVERALRYRITSVEMIRRIALLYVHHDLCTVPSAEVDSRFQQREAYLEGRLTDQPDFSAYDDLLEDHHE